MLMYGGTYTWIFMFLFVGVFVVWCLQNDQNRVLLRRFMPAKVEEFVQKSIEKVGNLANKTLRKAKQVKRVTATTGLPKNQGPNSIKDSQPSLHHQQKVTPREFPTSFSDDLRSPTESTPEDSRKEYEAPPGPLRQDLPIVGKEDAQREYESPPGHLRQDLPVVGKEGVGREYESPPGHLRQELPIVGKEGILKPGKIDTKKAQNAEPLPEYADEPKTPIPTGETPSSFMERRNEKR